MTRISKIAKSPPATAENVLNRLGRNIRTARLQRKLSKEELAERIGISRYVAADIEKGKPITAIAAYLGALRALCHPQKSSQPIWPLPAIQRRSDNDTRSIILNIFILIMKKVLQLLHPCFTRTKKFH